MSKVKVLPVPDGWWRSAISDYMIQCQQVQLLFRLDLTNWRDGKFTLYRREKGRADARS